MRQRIAANEFIETELDRVLGDLGREFGADVLTYIGPIMHGVDDVFRDTIEDLSSKQSDLMVILETGGGYAEVASRISDTLRHHYQTVKFLVPSYAMSAGTILVMSGDEIWMDYYSVLGPIDPQVERGSQSIPALGYLIQYEKLMKKGTAGTLSSEEMAILLNFDQGELYAYEQARELSRTLLKEWLVKYKFKNWSVTETNRTPVTPAMRETRALEIAAKLDDPKEWNSHGFGINREIVERKLGLKIDHFDAKPDVHKLVRRYHKLLLDYLGKLGQSAAMHSSLGYEPLG